MNILDKIRNYAASRGYGKDDDAEYEDDYDDTIEETEKYSRGRYEDDEPVATPISSRSTRSSSIYGGGGSRSGTGSGDVSGFHSSKIVDISANVRMQLVLSAPQSIDEAMEVCNYVISNKIVSINLEGLDHAMSQRIVDFLSGAAYALGGDIQSTGGNRNFIIAPQSVDITGHLKEELKASGILFSMKTGTK